MTVQITHGRNFVGSGERSGLFLQEWKKQSGEEFPLCAVANCTREATDGAHVKIVDNTNAGNRVFVVPMCHDHNKVGEHELRFKPGTRGMEVQH